MKLQPKYLENRADYWPLENYGVSTGKTKLEIMAASCLAVVPPAEKCSLVLSELDFLYIMKHLMFTLW